MKNYCYNILSVCLLALLLIVGFALLTSNVPTALPSISAMQTTDALPGHDSHWAVLLGIVGLVYLKVIWKLIHAPDIFDK